MIHLSESFGNLLNFPILYFLIAYPLCSASPVSPRKSPNLSNLCLQECIIIHFQDNELEYVRHFIPNLTITKQTFIFIKSPKLSHLLMHHTFPFPNLPRQFRVKPPPCAAIADAKKQKHNYLQLCVLQHR